MNGERLPTARCRTRSGGTIGSRSRWPGCGSIGLGPDGSEIDSCTIIVTDANALLAPIHDRMPVILDAADYGTWLDPSNEDKAALQSLLRPTDPAGWTAYAVSRAVNSPRNDSPALLEPAASG